jgi:hypothetical protein
MICRGHKQQSRRDPNIGGFAIVPTPWRSPPTTSARVEPAAGVMRNGGMPQSDKGSIAPAQAPTSGSNRRRACRGDGVCQKRNGPETGLGPSLGGSTVTAGRWRPFVAVARRSNRYLLSVAEKPQMNKRNILRKLEQNRSSRDVLCCHLAASRCPGRSMSKPADRRSVDQRLNSWLQYFCYRNAGRDERGRENPDGLGTCAPDHRHFDIDA